jgi:hypothetical protein
VDGKFNGETAFKNGLSAFATTATFEKKNVMDFPADAKVLMSVNLGSVTFDAYMALVIDIDVTGDNTFTAQSGAYANADTTVALYVFEKGLCEYAPLLGVSQQEVHDSIECKAVLEAAKVTQTQVESCTAPLSSASTSGKCFDSKYLIIQKFEKPTFRSGLNGPSLKAKTANAVSMTISVYPIARITAYKGIFSLYAVPELKSVVKADPSSASTCANGVEIKVSIVYVAHVAGHRLSSLHPFVGPSAHLESNLRLG